MKIIKSFGSYLSRFGERFNYFKKKNLKSLDRYRDRYSENWDYVIFELNCSTKVIGILKPTWRYIFSTKLELIRLITLICESKFSPAQIAANRKVSINKNIERLKNLFEKDEKTRKMFANLHFIGSSTSYTQDKVHPFRDYIDNCSNERKIKFINRLHEFYEDCWKLGFSDISFNYDNYGVTLFGDIVMTNISDITFSPEDISEIYISMRWLSSKDSIKQPREVQAYEIGISVENYRKHLNKNSYAY